MRRLSVNELRKIQIEILDVVDEFCKKNKIDYWINCGTLIGAIRHKGYIPWDDDIDLGMLRADYDKFSELFNKTNTRYRFLCIENEKNFYCPYGKVADTMTYMKDGHADSYINIDIFVYDHAPMQKSEIDKMFNKRDIYRKLYYRQVLPVDSKIGCLKKLESYLIKGVLGLVPKTFFIKKMICNSKLYEKEAAMYVGDFVGTTNTICDINTVKDFVDVEFEGKFYKAPIGYDKWLKAFYGNYMELPPIEKRVTHHIVEAYIK